MTWDDVADLMNSELGETNTSNKYRKEFTRKFKDMIDTREDDLEEDQQDLYDKISEQLIEIRKERTIISDLRRDANAQLRAFDRINHLKEIAIECAKEINKDIEKYRFKPLEVIPRNKEREILLVLCDWHFGIEINSYWNKYNPEICKERLQKVLEQTIAIARENKSKVINIFNLGDLISGRIHSRIRMQSRINAVQQTLKVGVLLEEFILSLRMNDFVVKYHSCLDNHSRVEPNKKESLQLESFAPFIQWHLQTAFKNIPDVFIYDNEYGEDIICTDILGHTIVGVHGDKDEPKNVVKSLTSLLSFKPDLICTAHKHHLAGDETNRCPVLCCPSLMGQDQYALDLRLDSSPAQLLVVVTEDDPMHYVSRLLV